MAFLHHWPILGQLLTINKHDVRPTVNSELRQAKSGLVHLSSPSCHCQPWKWGRREDCEALLTPWLSPVISNKTTALAESSFNFPKETDGKVKRIASPARSAPSPSVPWETRRETRRGHVTAGSSDNIRPSAQNWHSTSVISDHKIIWGKVRTRHTIVLCYTTVLQLNGNAARFFTKIPLNKKMCLVEKRESWMSLCARLIMLLINCKKNWF